MRYPIYLEFDPETDSWAAVAPTFSATSGGATREEALSNIKELIEQKLDEDDGDVVPTSADHMAIQWVALDRVSA